METISFDKLLLKTAFCCMASDGEIHKKEVEIIKKMCQESILLKKFDFNSEINTLLTKINEQGNKFITNYFDELNNANLSDEEELSVINFAINTINADDIVEYSEIKFFKAIRKCLKIENNNILAVFPDLEYYLEEDIKTENSLDKLVASYLNSVEIPQFVNFNLSSIENE